MSSTPHDDAPPNWLQRKVSNWFWSLTPTCKEVARLTSERRDHPLPLGLRLRLSLHRSFCEWCARYAKQLKLLHQASHLFPERVDELRGPTLESDAKARIKRSLRQRADEGS